MKKYLALVVLSVLVAAVASFNLQTTISTGSGNSNVESAAPFEKIGKNYYIIEPNITTTWLGAVNFCRTQGAHLASIETAEEWQTISGHLMSKGYRDWFWIGGNDIDRPFLFFWISSGLPIYYTKWSVGQPDNKGGIERCVLLWCRGNEYPMNDADCQLTGRFICKADNPNTISITVW